MDANWAAIIIGMMAAAPGVFALIVQQRRDVREAPQANIERGIIASKNAAEVVEQYSRELMAVRAEVETLRKTVATMQAELATRDALIGEWQGGIDRLVAQLVSIEVTPVWRPKKSGGG